MRFIIFSLSLVIYCCFTSCTEDREIIRPKNTTVAPCGFTEVNEKIWVEEGSKFLWGGDEDHMHFNISNWALDECNLSYGLGREKFLALIKPGYKPKELITGINEQEKCLVLTTNIGTFVYPYATLSYHEVVNETFDENPIAVAYCELADLAVVYDRIICDVELTFAISGYAYSEPAVWDDTPSFVFWDRETESLWWPLIDLGVSGVYNGVFLEKYDLNKWTTLRWEEVKEQYPDCQVLDVQEQEIPSQNYKIDPSLVKC